MIANQILFLAGGAVLFALLGAVHMGGLRVIGWGKRERRRHPHLSVVVTFWSLGLLHLIEIAIGALVLWLLLFIPGSGSLGATFGGAPADYLYVAGISFVTLGFAEVEAQGAIRMVVMLLSLAGFMLITWSATFIYTIWGESFHEKP